MAIYLEIPLIIVPEITPAEIPLAIFLGGLLTVSLKIVKNVYVNYLG